MNEIAESFSDIASFMMVYISEAHATDVWPLGNTVCVNQHKSIEDRIKAAKEFIVEERKNKIPLFVDTMDNVFDENFHAWPERFYIIQGNAFKFIGKPSKEDKGFDKEQIVEWLEFYRKEQTNKINDQKIEVQL